MRKKISVPVIAVLIIAGVYSAWSYLSPKENAWVCEDGQWVRHGNTKAEKPSGSCGAVATNEAANTEDNKAKWERIKEVIGDCGVVSISENSEREVTVSLRNTLTIKAFEPAKGDVESLEKAAEEKCGKVPVSTVR